VAIATHGGDFAHFGHGGQAASEFANHLFFVATQFVDVDSGGTEVHAQGAQMAESRRLKMTTQCRGQAQPCPYHPGDIIKTFVQREAC
jgi:hypothetical protein